MDRRGRVDMSSEAIDRRLREVAQLYKLGMSIRRAKLLGRHSPAVLERKTSPTPERNA